MPERPYLAADFNTQWHCHLICNLEGIHGMVHLPFDMQYSSSLDQGKDAVREACLARNFSADMAVAVADRAVQILGGHGYIREHPVEMWMRNARGFASFTGLTIV